MYSGTSFQILLGGGNCPPKQNSIGEQITKSGEQISNGTVKLPEDILTNSHFQLEKNEIVIKY